MQSCYFIVGNGTRHDHSYDGYLCLDCCNDDNVDHDDDDDDAKTVQLMTEKNNRITRSAISKNVSCHTNAINKTFAMLSSKRNTKWFLV